jgi:uncharacterized protein
LRSLFSLLVTAALVAVPVTSRAATGPSFDCGRATAPVEHLICSSDTLSQLDSQLGDTFRARREAADEAGRAAMLAEQRRWLVTRLGTCLVPTKGDVTDSARPAAETCLAGSYRNRIAALAPPAETPKPAVPATTPAASSGVTLDHSIFPARGENEALLNVASFGRYAIAVKSDQGAALQLVDRMAGPGAVQGIAGARDGRIDAFLDRGTYRLRLTSDAKGAGDAELTVKPSTELQSDPVQLVELKPVVAELGDHEQRSWWLEVKKRGAYAFEAAGRRLNELRLWRDGAWMVDAVPQSAVHDSAGGQPLAFRRLAATLEPGLYRLTAYGGAGEPWASGATANPFLLRWGVPALGEADRSVHEASAFGIDRYLVPGGTEAVRLVLDQPEAASVTVTPWNADHPFPITGDRATIDKKSRDPVAEVRPAATGDDEDGNTNNKGKGRLLVTVERTPGARYRLEIFNHVGGTSPTPIKTAGDHLLAMTLPGNPDDEIDPTFILTHKNRDITAASVIELPAELPWRRHFNLTDPAEMFIHVASVLDLKIDGTGANAEFIVEPFLTQDGNFKPVKPKPAGAIWQLSPGYWVLHANPKPDGRGVLTLSLSQKDGPAPTKDHARLTAALFAKTNLVADANYTLYANQENGTAFGAELRHLPASVAQPLAFELPIGGKIDLPVTVAGAGRIIATAEDGKPLPIAIDQQAASPAAAVTAGAHRLSIAGLADRPTYVSIAFLADALRPDTPLPPIPPDKTTPPEMPRRAPGPPGYYDLAASQSLSFALPVDHPALYRVESLGLVEMGGALRTRILPMMATAEANGIGRNFLLQQYLREGDYQVTVKAAGKSYGRIGVAIGETPVLDRGLIEADLPARLTLPPGEAAAYRIHVATEGDYHIRTLGLGHDFAMRLDDADGWPLLEPGGKADAELRLKSGDYHMILLPQPVENRAVTILHRVEKPVERSGHGPFDLAFGTEQENRWLEPDAGQKREPDRWRFTLPAPATATVTIDAGMRALITGPGGTEERVAITGTPWQGKLPAGSYVIEAMSAAPNNRVDYGLKIETEELVAGQKRAVTAPTTIKLSLGSDRQIELSSFGATDVAGRLYDSAGHLVATNDDRDNDWNFAIAGHFPPGAYTLRIDPVGGKSADTEIALSESEEIAEPALAFDQPAKFEDGKLHIVPLPESKPGTLLLIGADAAVPVGLTLEAKDGTGDWRGIDATTGMQPYLALPRGDAAGRNYRARVWAVDRGKTPITLTATAAMPGTASEAALAAGLALPALKLGGQNLGAIAITLARPGLLQLAETEATLRSSGTAEHRLAHDQSGAIVAPGSTVWLTDRQPGKIAARRIDPAAGPTRLTLDRDGPLKLPIATSDQPAFWRIEGQGGQPGIAVASADAKDAPPLMAAGVDNGAIAGAIAFAPAGLGKPVLKLWPAGSGLDALPVTIERIGFATPKKLTVAAGITDGTLAAHAALQLGLPAGRKRLSLTLPAETAAVLIKDGTPQRLLRSAGGTADIVETEADTVLLLAPNSNEAPYSLAIETLSGPGALILAPGGLLTRYSPVSQMLHLSIAEGEPAALRMAGAVRQVIAIDAAGQITRGADARAGKGSQIDIEVKHGLSALALDGPAGAAVAPDHEVTPPASLALEGKRMAIRLPAGPTRLVHVETEAPIVLRGSSMPALFAAGAALNLVQGAKQALDLSLESASAGPLTGTARFEIVAPLPIQDGLGPKLRLPPGQSRLFSFTLPEERAIGVGVRASIDIANCRLLTEAGEELGTGLVQMQTLKAGNYLLAVDVPVDGVAVDIEPALVGATPPGKGPPDAVKADYLALVAPPQR